MWNYQLTYSVEGHFCAEFVLPSFSLSVVNCMCPWCGCFALSYVLAAHLHPCTAPASSGLLLVSLTTPETHTHIHIRIDIYSMNTRTYTNTISIIVINVYTPSFSLLPLTLLLSLIFQSPPDTHTYLP